MGSYLDKGSCNSGLTAVAANPVLLRCADDGFGMLGLNRVKAREVVDRGRANHGDSGRKGESDE
jgi:hypothetical protein